MRRDTFHVEVIDTRAHAFTVNALCGTRARALRYVETIAHAAAVARVGQRNMAE